MGFIYDRQSDEKYFHYVNCFSKDLDSKWLLILFLLTPLVLFPHLEKYTECGRTFLNFPNLLLLSLSEVILDVESLPDLLRSLPLDHVGHGLAGHVEETLQDGCEGGGGVKRLSSKQTLISR